MRPVFLSAIFLIVSTIGVQSFAQDSAPSSSDIKQAAAAYDLGRERFREGQFIEAAEKFEAADEAAPSASALRLAIFARKEAGNIARALTHAALALELYPDNSQLAEEAQTVLDESGAAFAKLTISCDSPCELLLNNRIVHGRARTARTVFMKAGSGSLRASWSEGRTQSEEVVVDAGDQTEVSFYAPELPAETVPEFQESSQSTSADVTDQPKKEGWHPAVFWTSLGLTVAGGGAIVALGINAQNNPGVEEVRDKCVAGDTECDEFKQGKTNQMYVNVAIGATAAFGVFTVASAFLTDWGGKDTFAIKKGDLSLRPTFAVGNGASLGATGTF